MPVNEEIPEHPASLATARQFGRYLAVRIRGARTQRAVVNLIDKLAGQGAIDDLNRLTTQRLSKMENLDGSLPTSDELRAYLLGCEKLDQFDALEAVRRKLQRSLVEADIVRESSARVPAPVSVALAGLPAEVGFIGRDESLALLDSMLLPDIGGSESVVVSTVAGLAGIGKTSLVVRAAHRAVASGWFPGGVLFVDLHGYDPAGGTEPAAALAALLGALGIPGERIPPTQDEREVLYRSELAAMADQDRRVLVVADNASDLRQVLALRPGSPVHRMVVTSRDTLPVPGARRVELEVLSQSESIAVVAQALRAAHPGDERIKDEPDAAVDLVRLCGHLPLALRITAELLADKPGQQIGEQVEIFNAARDRLGELEYGDSVAVRMAFEASYQHLPAAQAEMFRSVALHPGPYFDLDSAAALADAPRDVARHLIEGLLRAHLLQSAAVRHGYRFHDLVRLYAEERCERDQTAAERDAAIDRLLDYYRDTAHASGAYFDPNSTPEERSRRFADQLSALTWLENERANLVAVVTLAVDTGQDRHAIDTALPLRHFFNRRKFWDDWITTSTCALTSARRLGDRDSESMALNGLSVIQFDLRHFEESLEFSRQILAIAREIGNRRREVSALDNIGNALQSLGRLDEAFDSHRQALSILRDGDDQTGLDGLLNNLGFAFATAGRFDEAIDCYRESLAQFQKIGNPVGIAVVLTNLGAAYQKLERWDEALDHHLQALAILEGTKEHVVEGRTLHNIATTYEGLGQYDNAIAHHLQALAVRREVGDRHGEGVTLTGLGSAYEAKFQFDEALEYLQQALTVFIEANADDDVEKTRIRIAALLGDGPPES